MGSNFNIHLVQHSLKFFQQRRNSKSGVAFVLLHAISACRLAESVSGGETGSVHSDTNESAGGQQRAKGR